MSVRLSGRSAGNTWSVNLGNFFFFFLPKNGVSENFTGR